MQSFDQSLMELLNKDIITFDEALLHSARPEDFRIRYDGITAMDGKKWSNDGHYDKKVADQWQNMTEVEIVVPTELKPMPEEDDEVTQKRKDSGGRSSKK